MPSMRSRSVALLLYLGLVPLTAGCDDEARQFARRTAEILQLRSAELSKKIAAETKAYQKAATIATEVQRDLIESALANERSARSIAIAADYHEGRRQVSRWQSDLAEYAEKDHRLNRDLLASDIDAGAVYLQKLQALEVEQAKVDALAKLLAALAKKPTLAEDIQSLAAFGEDVKEEFDKKVCLALAEDTSAAGQAAFKAKGCKK